MQPGLTLIVGPPGTGKTDVAVQIISNIYHNHPNERTLIVTHSNTALNQLFEKIMALDIDERHLLRLGRGEEMLETEKDFSKYGRVDYVLADRMRLLDIVARLASTLSGKKAVFSYFTSHSLRLSVSLCFFLFLSFFPFLFFFFFLFSQKEMSSALVHMFENAAHFYLHHVVSRWEEFLHRVESDETAAIADCFPFADFFSDAPQPLFTGDRAANLEKAHSCMRYLNNIFETLGEYRPFEILHRVRTA